MKGKKELESDVNSETWPFCFEFLECVSHGSCKHHGSYSRGSHLASTSCRRPGWLLGEGKPAASRYGGHERCTKSHEATGRGEALKILCEELTCVPSKKRALRSLSQRGCLHPSRIHQRNNHGQESIGSSLLVHSIVGSKKGHFLPFLLISSPDSQHTAERRVNKKGRRCESSGSSSVIRARASQQVAGAKPPSERKGGGESEITGDEV